jgi:hypothetical protein
MFRRLPWLRAGSRVPLDQPGKVSLALAGVFVILALELGLLLL